MTELKPCPFCGRYDDGIDGNWKDDLGVDDDVWGYVHHYWIHCNNCGTDGPRERDTVSAIESWNRRFNE